MRVPGADVRPGMVSRHQARRVAAPVCAVAEDPHGAAAPAARSATRCGRARMVDTGARGGEGEAARHWNWRMTVRVAALSQLPVKAVPPTGARTGYGHTAHVQAGADCRECESTRHRDGCHGASRCAVADLAIAAVPPAVRGAARYDDTAGEVKAGAHLRRIQRPDDSERHGRIAAQSGGGGGQRVAGAHEVDTEVSEDHQSRFGGSRGP